MRYFHPAKKNELQIDLDGRRALTHFYYAIAILKTAKHVTVKGFKVWNSKTKNHYHASVTLVRNLPAMERLVLQMSLGDDPLRGLLGWGRVRNNDPHPILFIESTPFLNAFDLLGCDCEYSDKLPRCKHLRKLQTSNAEFLPRNWQNQ